MCKMQAKENNGFYGKKHTIETKTKIGEKNKGKYIKEKNPNAKTFRFISPNQEEYIVTGNFIGFCKSQGIRFGSMQNVLYNKQENHKGWKVEIK